VQHDPTDNMSRQEIEDIGRKRLAEARVHYEFAVANLHEVLETQHHGIASPQAGSSIEQAHILESEALGNYLQALQGFTDLVVHGRAPEG
jgi:hypothetical protein